MTDVRTFKCDTCGQEFATSNGLGGHLSAAHKRQVPCLECGKLVREGVGMTQHMKLVHGSKKGDPASRTTCPECGKNFRRNDIARHLRNVHHINGGLRGYMKQAVATLNTSVEVITKPAKRKPLTAEQITRTACAMLWPDGVPMSQLEAVLRWNTQTAEFLHRVVE